MTDETPAYEANYGAHRPGITSAEVVDYYNKWASEYEKDLCRPGVYNGPSLAAEAVASYFGENRSAARIIDVAAGSGLVGLELSKRGFTHVDALDPSKAMLDEAAKKSVYVNLFCCAIGEECESLPKGAYDCLVLSGGMGEGHIPCSALRDMVSLPKKGGLICIVMREEYLSYVKDYVDKLEPEMARLEEEGKWLRASREIVPNYSFGKNGVVYKYIVL